MNHELRCYLRLRINIPNEILLLIEKYLWQRNLAPTNLTIYQFSRNVGPYSPRYFSFSQTPHGRAGLLYLHLNQYHGEGSHYPYRKSGKSSHFKAHYYGPDCIYNLHTRSFHCRTLPTIDKIERQFIIDNFLANEFNQTFEYIHLHTIQN